MGHKTKRQSTFFEKEKGKVAIISHISEHSEADTLLKQLLISESSQSESDEPGINSSVPSRNFMPFASIAKVNLKGISLYYGISQDKGKKNNLTASPVDHGTEKTTTNK